MATKLQKPPYVYMNGRITPWDEAKIHVYSEALIRGVSVFEGIKGYWDRDGRVFNLLALRRHFERLQRSARLMHLPFEMKYEDFSAASRELVRRLLVPGKDLWLRPTLFAIEGHWGEGTKTDLVITAYTQEMARPTPIEIGISTWQRPGDASYPARIKSAANYQVGRLARIEGRAQGFSDMVLLNERGRVAEATGSCVVLVRNGGVVTPPPSESCLESITIDIIEQLCRSLSVPFARRPVDRTELYVAEEICIAGTLAELVPVSRVEFATLAANPPVLGKVADAFWELVRGARAEPGVELTPV
jgi:branched-chain amino acid aminotransferase